MYQRDRFRYVYERHLVEVTSYFEGRPGSLLVLDICAGQGWKQLCPFLDRPVPGITFPKENVGRQQTEM
jgi:hypothetical protein